MTIDRRKFDPYAPAPSATEPAVEAGGVADPQDSPPAQNSPTDAAAMLPDDLDDITKADLIALAELADVATYGTKVEIADRIRVAAG